MAGAIDLFAGSSSVQGSNVFKVDKSPLNQMDGGIQSVIGKQASGSGGGILTALESVLRAVMGFDPLESIIEIGSELLGTAGNLGTYFGNLEKFLGELNPLDPSFNPIAAAANFITTVLDPTGLLTTVEDVLGSILGSGGKILTSLLPEIPTDLIAGLGDLIDTLSNAINGGSVVGQSLDGLGNLLAMLVKDVSTANEMANSAWAQVQNIGGTVVQLVQEAESNVFLTPLQLAEQFLSSIGSWWGQTKISNSPNNPSITALNGRQAALEAYVLGGGSTSTGFNDHLNRATLGGSYTQLGANAPEMVFDGASDGYLGGGALISGVRLTDSTFLPLVTDRNRFQWSLRGLTTFGNTGRHRVLICGNSTFSNCLAVEVYHTGFADRIRMFAITSGDFTSTGAQKTNWTPPHSFKEFDTLDIAYDPVTNTFFLYYNNAPADYWPDLGTSPTDPSNLIAHGVGHRETCVVNNCDSSSGAVGLGVDDISVWDYAVNT